MRHALPMMLLTLATAGCADDLRNDAPDATTATDAAVSSSVVTVREGSLARTTVDATRADAWTYLDLDTGAASSADAAGWDLAFQRFKVKTNGGANGAGNVEVALLDGARFEDVTTAPTAGWTRDAASEGDAGTGLAFAQGGGWYAYDPASHQLAPRAVVYVVRSTAGRAYRLRFTGYYDSAGTAGFVRFEWAQLGGTP